MSSAVIVVDASAVLVFLQDEKGVEFVDPHITGALISAVNFAEVLSKFSDLKIPSHEQEALVALLALEIVPFDADSAMTVGHLREETKSLGLSLGDRACIGLGIAHEATILTADRAWKNISSRVLGAKCHVECIR